MASAARIFNVPRRNLFMGRIVPEIDPSLEREIRSTNVNPKRLKTRRNIGMTRLPATLEIAAQNKIQRVGTPQFRAEALRLVKIMQQIKLPDDQHTIKKKKADLKIELEVRDKIKARPDHNPTEFELAESTSIAKSEFERMVEGTLEDRRRDWHYYEYNEYSSCLYMAARLAPNFGAIRTVMQEIKLQDPSYKPETVLDFGSGLGTVAWAVEDTWPDSVREFLNIDLSKDQQELCDYLLRGGKEFGHPIPNVFHRQYLPTSSKVCYDLVISAFTMLELPNVQMRIHAIENLWHKTKDLLVLIERGTKGGFSTIDEARHLILDLGGHKVTDRMPLTFESKPRYKFDVPKAHVIAPCPHEYFCPRANMSSLKRQDVCRFGIFYEPLEIGIRKPQLQREEFSYVVFRKGPHPMYDGTSEHAPRWPRIVEPAKVSGGQRTIKLCCANGCLAECLVTKTRYGKETYQLAKACDWGDIFPCKVNDTYIKRSTELLDDK